MKYLSFKQILLIHSILIDETGGSHGVRDINRIKSVAASPRQPYYKTNFDKAAVYMRSIVQDHPFVDGNKRTGITSAVIFLARNDVRLEFKPSEIEDYAVRVATEKLTIRDIALWIEEHA